MKIINRQLIIIQFLILLSLFACGDSEQVKTEKYNILLTEVEKNLHDEDYENVIVKADEALKIYDKYSQPNMYKAIAYYRQDRIRKSIKEAKKIIEKDGEKSTGTKILAQVYYHKKNNVEKSLKYALQYNEVFPDDAENAYLLGNVFYEQNKYDEAIKFYSICIDQDFYIHQSLANRSMSLERLGLLTESIEDYIFLRQISDSSDFKTIDFRLAELYQKEKNYVLSNFTFMKIDSVLSDKYIAQNYRYMNENDSSLMFYNKYISSVSNDAEALKERYDLLKKSKIGDNELFENYKEIKKIEYKNYNLILKILYLVVPFLLISYLLYRISNHFFNKQYYDSYNITMALKYILCIPFGGAFNYTKNIYIVYFNVIVTSSLLVYMINCFIFNGRGEYFIKLMVSINFFIVLISILGVIFVIDLLTIFFRVKYMNINIRKNLNKKEVEDRKHRHNQVVNEISNANKKLDQILKE